MGNLIPTRKLIENLESEGLAHAKPNRSATFWIDISDKMSRMLNATRGKELDQVEVIQQWSG